MIFEQNLDDYMTDETENYGASYYQNYHNYLNESNLNICSSGEGITTNSTIVNGTFTIALEQERPVNNVSGFIYPYIISNKIEL
jgi:hypothetical protein